MWKTVQSKGGIAKPVQLIIDMKVRWSSTYLMLHMAKEKKMVSTQYIFYCSYSFFYSLSTPLLMLSRAEGLKYNGFAPAVKATCTKIDEYYEKTADSPAYILAMSTSLLFMLITISNDY